MVPANDAMTIGNDEHELSTEGNKINESNIRKSNSSDQMDSPVSRKIQQPTGDNEKEEGTEANQKQKRQESLANLRESGIVMKNQKFLQKEAFQAAGDDDDGRSPPNKNNSVKNLASIADLKTKLEISSKEQGKPKERRDSLSDLHKSGFVGKNQKILEEGGAKGMDNNEESPPSFYCESMKNVSSIADLKFKFQSPPTKESGKQKEKRNSLSELHQSAVVGKLLEEGAVQTNDDDTEEAPPPFYCGESLKNVSSIADLKFKLQSPPSNEGGKPKERRNSLSELHESGVVMKNQTNLMEEFQVEKVEAKPESAIKGIVKSFGGSKKPTVVRKQALQMDEKTKKLEKSADAKALIKTKWVDSSGQGTFRKKYAHEGGVRSRKSLEELP